MNTNDSIHAIAEAFNARAKAAGMLLEQDPWTLPALYEGSVLDIPSTPEAQERTRKLETLLAQLEQENAKEMTEESGGGPSQDRLSPPSASDLWAMPAATPPS